MSKERRLITFTISSSPGREDTYCDIIIGSMMLLMTGAAGAAARVASTEDPRATLPPIAKRCPADAGARPGIVNPCRTERGIRRALIAAMTPLP